MFCKKCHKKIIKEVKNIHNFFNSCHCHYNTSSEAIITNTKLTGITNSLPVIKRKRITERSENKIKRKNKKIN